MVSLQVKQKRGWRGTAIGPPPPLPLYRRRSQNARAKSAQNRMVDTFPALLTSRSGRAFGQGFARPSAAAFAAAALRLMVRSASPSGRAAPALRHGSALRIRHALHRGGPSRGGYAPRSPVRSPRARLRSASASAVCAAAAGSPPGPAGRLCGSAFSPRASALASRGIGRAFASGRRPLVPLPFCEPALRACSRAARRPGQAAPPPV